MVEAPRWMKVDRHRCAQLADWLAVAFAISLPWSTSATGILVVLWLLAVIPTLDAASLRRSVSVPAIALPVLLIAVALVGMLWAVDVPLKERFNGLQSFSKLLFIPLLILHFQRSEHAFWVLKGFLFSCVVMLALSWVLVADPGLPGPWHSAGGRVGVPVKDYIAQSTEFTVCLLVLAGAAVAVWQRGQRKFAAALALLSLMFLVNILWVSFSRTSAVIIPIMLLLFTSKYLPWKASAGVLLAAALVGGMAAWSVAEFRVTMATVWSEVRDFKPEGERTRAGERLGFWIKSVDMIAAAPVIGHGTGSIRNQFRKTVEGRSGMAALAAANPHNQSFAVAIQLGLLGTIVLFAMWMAHASLFLRGAGFAAWVGLVVSVQNIIGSLFNSHLFDFTQGWGYVLGVGVAAGAVLKDRVSPGVSRPS